MTRKEQVDRYVLGTHPRLKVTTLDEAGEAFEPSELRLTVKNPDGTLITYSGGDVLQGSGFQYIIYAPGIVGWYQWETWVKDGNGLEDAATKGFEIYDLVYQD